MGLEILGKPIEGADVSEFSERELEEGSKVLEPDYEYIKTRPIEAIREANTITNEVGDVTQVEAGFEDVVYNETSMREVITTTVDYRPLTQEEIQSIQESTNMSDATLQDCTINSEGTIKLTCVNEYKVDAPSEVPYVNYTVTINNYEIQVVMPEFPEVLFETTVPPEMYSADDWKMFKHCTEELRSAIVENPELGKKFSEEQLDQIMNGAPRIKGLTWHHGPECGNMQLVPTKMHSEYRHTGGKAIWGGGRT